MRFSILDLRPSIFDPRTSFLLLAATLLAPAYNMQFYAAASENSRLARRWKPNINDLAFDQSAGVLNSVNAGISGREDLDDGADRDYSRIGRDHSVTYIDSAGGNSAQRISRRLETRRRSNKFHGRLGKQAAAQF